MKTSVAQSYSYRAFSGASGKNLLVIPPPPPDTELYKGEGPFSIIHCCGIPRGAFCVRVSDIIFFKGVSYETS
jgi:hypothetical protein